MVRGQWEGESLPWGDGHEKGRCLAPSAGRLFVSMAGKG